MTSLQRDLNDLLIVAMATTTSDSLTTRSCADEKKKMSERDQPDDEFADAPATRATSGTMDSDSERDGDLPSFDAYGDEENWSALEDDESLGSDPEWAEDRSVSEEASDWSEQDPEQDVSPRGNADESDSLFDDLDDDNVTLGSSRSSDRDDGSGPSKGSSTDEFDGEEDEAAATPPAALRDQAAIDDDDDYYRPKPPAASRLKSKKEKKTHWAWPTSVGLLTLAVIGLAGFSWYQSTQQEQAMRSMQVKLRQAQQTPQAEAPSKSEGQIQALQEELNGTRKLHNEEIAELEDRNQTLQAKLSSVERALEIARSDAANTSNASVPPSVASSPQPQSPSSSGWFINVQTYATRADADAMVARLASYSEAFAVQPAQVNGRTLFRVRASGYASQSGAEEVAAELVEAFALPKPWIGRDS